MRGTEESQYIHARVCGVGKGQCFSPKLPGIGDSRGQIETALIEIKQLDNPLYMTFPEFISYSTSLKVGYAPFPLTSAYLSHMKYYTIYFDKVL